MIALTDIARIQREAITMLASLTSQAAIIETLRPRAEDYPRVFVPSVSDIACIAYTAMWNAPPKSFAKPGQTEIIAHACDAESLTTENEFSNHFPGGYRKIAQLLVPDVVWVAFKFVVPGESLGMAYDGLVRLGDRWAWFPKPFRHLLDQASGN